jgi:hypothetical protein
VHEQRLCHRLADADARVERAERILEDHLHAPAHAAQLASAKRAQIDAVEHHAAGIRLDEPQHQAPGGGFSRAGLADQREGLAGLQLEAHVVGGGLPDAHATEQVALRGEALAQAADLEQAHRAATAG